MKIDIEEFRKKYEEDLMTMRELSNLYGVSYSTIRRFCHQNGINVREPGNMKEKEYHFVSPFKTEVKDIEKMKELFYSCIPVKKMAEELQTSQKVIYRTIKEMGLVRPKSMMSRDQYDDTNDAEIVRLYKEGKSSTEIGKILGITHRAVLLHLRHCGVKRRTLSESQFNYNNKEFPEELKNFETLYDMYVENRMSKKNIAEQLNVSTHVIDRVLKEFGINIRGNSECKIGLMTGPDHPNWKGGRSGLYMRLRTYFRMNQVKPVIERDGKKCTICGSKKRLHVHHIIPFKEIFNKILSEHPDLEVQKNSEELYEIMTHDDRMNDLSNLITYCKDCHLYKIHGYKKPKKESN